MLCFSSRNIGGGGNWGVVFVGVFGEDESCADSGESSTTSTGSGGRSVCPDAVLLEAFDLPAVLEPRALPMVSSSPGSGQGALNPGDLTNVAWLDVLDFEESFERSSVLEVGLELAAVRERGLLSSVSRNEPALVLFSSRLVSGGLGGRSLLREDALLAVKSADRDRFISSAPMSVASGVGGLVPVRRPAADAAEETSSLLPSPTASLL